LQDMRRPSGSIEEADYETFDPSTPSVAVITENDGIARYHKPPRKDLVPWGKRLHSDQGRVILRFRAPSGILLPIAIVPAVV
jgi:hypothetical protein